MPFSKAGKPLVTVIDLHGVIASSAAGARKSLNIARLEKPIEEAFKPDGLSGVVLRINSPGGSPVQSRLVHDAIRRAADKKSVPVFAFVEDVGASGGYILALAGDEIYADASSIVGSIGVISSSFGLHDAIARIGIERRVYTAGRSKSQLDPFKPENSEDIDRLQLILGELHDHFIALVKKRRGTSLKDHDDIFTGAFWTAASARERGLIDGINSTHRFPRKTFSEKMLELKRSAPVMRHWCKSF